VDGAVDGVVLVGVGLPYFRTYPPLRGAVVLPYTQVIAATTALLGVWPGWSFGGRQARGVIRDWGYTARHGRYPRMAGVDVEAALRTIQTPVLGISLDDDQYTPPGTLDHLLDKLTAAPVQREHYTAAQATGALDHFRWVRASESLAARVAKFADEVAATRPT
jgi:predicted alpha/beta hydrolase